MINFIAKAVGKSILRQSLLKICRGTVIRAFYHSKPLSFNHIDMKVRLIPALDDNYMYLLIDEASRVCAAVDPVEPEKIVSAVKEEGIELKCVLTTHHHWDHANGNSKLVELVGAIDVYGGDDRVPSLTKAVPHQYKFKLGKLEVTCLSTPCHTSGHVCYYVTGPADDPLVFTGDTLFQAGCGKFFEGSAADMHRALNEILASLPANTRVYCGHEYTVNNLKFAQHVEPDNINVQKRLAWAQKQRANGEPTVPSRLSEELLFNPFMRVSVKEVKKHTQKQADVEVMGALRNEKDAFKPRM